MNVNCYLDLLEVAARAGIRNIPIQHGYILVACRMILMKAMLLLFFHSEFTLNLFLAQLRKNIYCPIQNSLMSKAVTFSTAGSCYQCYPLCQC